MKKAARTAILIITMKCNLLYKSIWVASPLRSEHHSHLTASLDFGGKKYPELDVAGIEKGWLDGNPKSQELDL